MCTLGLYFSFSAGFGALFSEPPSQSHVVIEQVRGGGSKNSDFLGKRKKFDLAFHRKLEQYFPDWEERMVYQEKQGEFYKSAMRKRREIIKLRMIDDSSLYSEKELNSINYFKGKGSYAKCQDPSVAPNIFDTRQSFLLKMHDISARKKFLKSFNYLYD